MIHIFFNKKRALLVDESTSSSSIKNISNKELAEEFHLPIIRNCKKYTQLL